MLVLYEDVLMVVRLLSHEVVQCVILFVCESVLLLSVELNVDASV